MKAKEIPECMYCVKIGRDTVNGETTKNSNWERFLAWNVNKKI